MTISPDIESGPFLGNGAQTAFAFGFTAITPAEVVVELNGVTQSGGFTVTLADVGGTVTFAAPPAAGAQIMLRSSPDYLQDSAFENEGAYNLDTVNTINRRQAVRALVTRDRAERAVKAPGGDAADMTLPTAAGRADKLLGFGAIGDGARPAVFDISAAALETLAASNGDITLLADNIGSIDSVAANLSGANTIGTVATNIADIDAVSGSIAAVNAVASDLTAINAVAGNAANVNAVAGNATNINSVAINATNVSAVAAISANVTQVANDRAALIAVASDLANLDAVATNLAAVNAVVAAAVTLGVFPSSAGVGGNIPRGAIAVNITAGTGGTNALNVQATWTGGTLTLNPQLLYDIVGGVMVNPRMTFPGLYIGASTPTMPTLSNTGLGTNTLTLTGGRLYNIGQGYWATSADGRTLDRVVNTANAPASDSAAVPSMYLKPAVDELLNAGGVRNYFPDPLLTDSSIARGFRNKGRSAIVQFAGGWNGILNAPAVSPYPNGKYLSRPNANVASPDIVVFLDKLGLKGGDVIDIAVEAATETGAATSGTNFLSGSFFNRSAAAVGSAFNVVNPTAGNPFNTTVKAWHTGTLMIPADAIYIRLSAVNWGLFVYGFYSFQITKRDAAPAKPVERDVLPNGNSRVRHLELYAPGAPANGVLQRRSSYTSAVNVSPSATVVTNNFAAFSGYGGSFLSAICPAGGFDMLGNQLNWVPSATTGPSRIYAAVYTCATGSNPFNAGTLVAIGFIDVDPLTGSAGSGPIQFFVPEDDGVPRTPKTVTPADLLDLVGICYWGELASGDAATSIFVTFGTGVGNTDPAYAGQYFFGDGTYGWGALNGGTFYPVLLRSTGGTSTNNTPSAAFAGAIGQYLDQPPDLLALPTRIWNVVGMETWLYWFGMQHRPPSRTNFQANYAWVGSYPANPSGQYEEGVCIKEASAGTKTLSIQASIGGTIYATKSTSIKTAANTAGAGTTRRLLVLGSSLAQNAGINTEILSLVADTTVNPGGAATGMNVVNVGTVGSAPYLNEGRSGQSIGIYFSPGDKFYNPGMSTFDITYYINTYLGGVAPTDIIVGDPFWSVASAATDTAAAVGAASCAALVELMITSIAAWNTANPSALINTIIWFPPHQPEFGQDGEARSLVGSVTQHQRNRNLREVAKLYAAQFGTSREASRVFACGFNVVGNAETAVARYTVAPRNPGARARISSTHGPYADYTTMVAAAGAINDAEIIQVGAPTAVSYWVKQGSGASGGFRPVTEIDGFVRRIIDSTHGCPYREMAQQVFACMKNNP